MINSIKMSNSSENREDYEFDGMNAKTKHDPNEGDKSWWIAAGMDVVFGVLVAILCGFFLYWSFIPDGVVLFAWHPALTSLGYILFMTEGIIIYNSEFLIKRGGKSYSNRILFHWIFHTIAIICITGGFVAIVWNKFRGEKHHFTSTHSIVGLIAYIFIFVAAAGGIVAKYSFQLRRKARPILMKLSHNVFGLATYYLGGATIILGLFTKWFVRNRTSSDAYFALAAILVIWIYTSLRPLGQIFRRLKQMCTSI